MKFIGGIFKGIGSFLLGILSAIAGGFVWVLKKSAEVFFGC